MIDPHPRQPPPGRAIRRSSACLGLIAVLALAGCGPSTPAASTPGASSAGSVGDTTPSNSGTSPATGQVDTAWGRIWETVPAAFPVYPGATPADDSASEPGSATFAVEGTDARTIAIWMQTELERSAYRAEALNGPLEDGSFELELLGSPADCRVQVAVAPLGGLVMLTVRYGAGCSAP